MKEVVRILAIGALGIAAAWWYLTPASLRNLFGRSVGFVIKDTNSQKQTKESVAAASPPKPVKRVRQQTPEKRPDPYPVAEESPSLPPPAPKSFPFPSADKVTIGANRSEILDEFGTPTLSASTADDGHLLETFVYKRDFTRAIIHLKDARVTDLRIRN